MTNEMIFYRPDNSHIIGGYLLKYIGIDPSTKTGLVILNKDGEVLHKEEITTNVKEEPQRFMDISDNLMRTIYQVCHDEPTKIAIEGFSYGSRGRGVSTQYGIGWGVRTKLVYCSRDYTEVSPHTLKKFAVGKANVKKEDMILPIYKRYGFEDDSDNVRDAYVLAQIARALDGKGKHTKAQLETIKELK